MVGTQNSFARQVEQLQQQYDANQQTIAKLRAIQQQNIYTINNKKQIIQQYKHTATLYEHVDNTYKYAISMVIVYLAFTVLVLHLSIRNYNKVTQQSIKEIQNEIYNSNNRNLYKK